MDVTVILAFASALLAAAVGVAAVWTERRSLAHWGFVAGMLVLAVERIFAGLAADSMLAADVAYWQNWRLAAVALVPATWLFFSVTYARGNYLESVAKWRFALGLFFLLPVTLAMAFHQELHFA